MDEMLRFTLHSSPKIGFGEEKRHSKIENKFFFSSINSAEIAADMKSRPSKEKEKMLQPALRISSDNSL